MSHNLQSCRNKLKRVKVPTKTNQVVVQSSILGQEGQDKRSEQSMNSYLREHWISDGAWCRMLKRVKEIYAWTLSIFKLENWGEPYALGERGQCPLHTYYSVTISTLFFHNQHLVFAPNYVMLGALIVLLYLLVLFLIGKGHVKEFIPKIEEQNKLSTLPPTFGAYWPWR